jgi:hypothetical protein
MPIDEIGGNAEWLEVGVAADANMHGDFSCAG